MNLLAAAEPESPVSDSAPIPPVTRPSSSAPQESITPPALDRSIEKTITKSKYSWRMPREKIVRDESQGPIGRFIDAVIRTLKNWIKKVLEWIGDVLDWIFRHSRTRVHGGGTGWIGSLQGLFFILIVVAACALALLLFRAWQNRHREVKVITSEAIRPVPDIADENVGAEQLPEDAWTKLGRELLARGEFRLALRAFYFASLAHLSTRNLITIAKFKSNRDYERELRRRGHALPDLLSLFGDNVSVFDRSWYGLRDVDATSVADFASKVERIKTAA